MRNACVILAVCTLFISCNTAETTKDADSVRQHTGVSLKYAKGFLIRTFEGYTAITIRHPQDTNTVMATYVLIPEGADTPEVSATDIVFTIPLQKVACVSTTHVGILEKLGLEEVITGISGTKYIWNAHVRELIEKGGIAEIGYETSFDYERLITLAPEAIFTYRFNDPDYDAFEKLHTLGLKTILINEYLELTPLGQAEWIKCFAAFFDALPLADSIFNALESNYLQIADKAIASATSPTVFTGLPFKGEWTVPGGKSFAATYLSDAGADYVWKRNGETGNFPVTLEQVIATALDADYWLHAGAAKSLRDIADADIRLRAFVAWKNGAVYNNNKRVNTNGGNDYWESGIVNPHLVLKDLVKIFHPELFSGDTLTYYTQLR